MGRTVRLGSLDVVLPGAASAFVVAALAFSSGGYFPSDQGLLTFAFALVALVAALLVHEVSVDRRSAILVGALAAFGAWTLASVAWSSTATWPALEAERVLLYVTAAAALALVVTRERVASLLAGIAAGITMVACYALATRLFPARIGGAYDTSSGYQLSAPIGYWNALGLLLVMGLLLALGFGLRAEAALRVPAGAALVPLSVALYYTFSRGSAAALLVGIVALLALRPDALPSVCALLLAPVVTVAFATRPEALTHAGASLASAQAAGERLAGVLVVLAVLAAMAAWIHPRITSRLTVAISLGRRAVLVIVLGMVVVAAGATVRAGGPESVVLGGVGAFRQEPPSAAGKLDRRLLSISGHGRADYWSVAGEMVGRSPILGEGAGGFERRWMQERAAPHAARDAHNLYLEMLAELGPLGLALLLAALAVPIAAIGAARRSVLGAAAAAAYCAFLVHAAVDWDWEIPVLVLTVVASGIALLVLAASVRGLPRMRLRRWPVVVALAVVMSVSLVVSAGNRAVADAARSLERGDAAHAESAARRARTWAPWSHEPWQLLGEAQLAARQDLQARASLRQAIRRAPDEWRLWFDLAIVSKGAERRAAITRAR